MFEKLNGIPLQEYGNWRNLLVHVLEKKELLQVRTIRNAFKISPDEQQALSKDYPCNWFECWSGNCYGLCSKKLVLNSSVILAEFTIY